MDRDSYAIEIVAKFFILIDPGKLVYVKYFRKVNLRKPLKNARFLWLQLDSKLAGKLSGHSLDFYLCY